jgi:hypothetical protein
MDLTKASSALAKMATILNGIDNSQMTGQRIRINNAIGQQKTSSIAHNSKTISAFIVFALFLIMPFQA